MRLHPPVSRLVRPARLALVALLLSAGAARAAGAAAAPAKALVVLSTSDLKGKIVPCGCHVPKGGLSRMASFADSVRTANDEVVLVNNGFFPVDSVHEDVAAFLMSALKLLGTDAVGISEKELAYGRAFLLTNARRSQLPLVCANLFDRASQRPLVEPYVLRTVGSTTVGVFGLTGPGADLGPSRDSLEVRDPVAVGRQIVGEMRAKGATVVVLLSQLGQFPSEDLVTAVAGIDAVVCGHGIPLFQSGRTIQRTTLCYGGEQGQNMGVTTLTLDDQHRVTKGACETVSLTVDVGENAAVQAVVQHFQDKSTRDRLAREKGATAGH